MRNKSTDVLGVGEVGSEESRTRTPGSVPCITE